MKLILSTLVLSLFVAISSIRAQSNLVGGQNSGAVISGNPVNTTAACDTIFSFPAVDTWPSGITFDGTHIWSSGYSSTYIYQHDLNGAVIDSVPNPSQNVLSLWGGDMDFDGTNILFFPEEGDTLYKLDPASGAVLTKYRITPCTTNCYGVAFDGTNIWISNYQPKELYKIDAATGVVLNTFVLSTPASMLPIKFINGNLYGLGVFPGELYKIDTTSGSVLNSIPWCLGYSLGFCRINNQIWGLSSQIPTGGTQRIYQFETLLLSDHSNLLTQTNTIKIYPNPTLGNAKISFGQNIKSGSVEITDILGQLIWTGKISDASETEINLQGNYSGVCFVKVFDGRNYISGKLMVEH